MTIRNALFLLWAGMVLTAGSFAAGQPLEITSGPTIGPAADAPLARTLELSTNIDSRVVVVAVAGVEGWQKDFETFSQNHSVALLGFKPDLAYSVEITVYDREGNSVQAPSSMVATSPLPAGFPPIVTTVSMPGKMETGYTLFGVRSRNSGDPNFTVILDNMGDVVWYRQRTATDIRQLPNGNLLYIQNNTGITESNLLGEDLRYWHPAASPTPPPPGSIIVQSSSIRPILFHHEAYWTTRGTILTSDRIFPIVEDYPTSETDPEAPTATVPVRDEPVVEFSAATGEVLGYWRLLDLLDPRRIGYDSVGPEGCAPDCPNDWGHVNAVIDAPGDPEDPTDDGIIVSLRHQDATIKFSRVTGELMWILGTHENWSTKFLPYLLTPVGPTFEWPYHQHAPVITPQGTLLLFDNGNRRASPFDGVQPLEDQENYSRAVEYAIDEQNMTVQQVWESGGANGEVWYVRFVSDADRLEDTGNTLITFGGISFIDHENTGGETVRIVEVDHNVPVQPVFQVEITDPDPGQGYVVYRSDRISDLYPSSIGLIFGDGFESGDTSEWNLAVP